ncbi:MAG: EAL domain-containing protein [Hyphomicrobiales bacterium]|nr:EAL domain-containing protein [Hyphomicrobiales bacterium]
MYGVEVKEETLAGRIRARQLRAIHNFVPHMLVVNVLNAMVLLLTFATSTKQVMAIAWSAVLGAYILFSYFQWRTTQQSSKRNYEPANSPLKAVAEGLVHGSIWSAFPMLFMGAQPPGAQLLVVAITIGMICAGAFTMAPLPSAAAAFVFPIIFGAIGAFYLHAIPYVPHLTLLMTLFAFMIVAGAYSQARLFATRILDDYEQQKKSEMIGMLLGEFEENASDWLWETDSLGRIAYISNKFSEMAKLPLETLRGKSFLRVMARGFEGRPEPAEAWRTITENMHQRTAFRGLELQIRVDGKPRWVNLTGRPIYGDSGTFSGFRGFCADVTDKREDEAKIAYLASFDAVTHLPNRVSFSNKMDESYRHLARKNREFTLHCIDLDGFKEINDTFGHAIGDAFLQEVAKRIADCLEEDDFVARLGGDEFSVIQGGTATEYDAARLAKTIIESISQPFTISGSTMKAGASIGIAFAPKDGDNRESLMVNGDLALYRAKSDGRGIFRFYDPSMDEYARERRKMEAELRTAIENGELTLLFQPILNVETDRVSNCEALLRWDNPALGQVSPADFIPVAEECGQIISIGEWVIQEACNEAAKWPDNVKVAVNLSPVQFQSPGLLPVIMKALESSGIEASRLEIEITETVLLSNIERVLAIIDTLEKLGVRIALDDFGTGYSSLAYVRQIDFDKIKIDASFVRDMIDDKSCAAIIRAVTGMAKELGIRITAEGVETQEQMDALVAEGCAEMQGYLISQPLTADEFYSFLSEPSQTARHVA